MKKLKKFTLNKEVITRLQNNEMNDIKGGVSASIAPECPAPVYTADIICAVTKITYGQCDVPTIGHDDGSICLSQTGFICGDWCYGRG